ncbi:MAG: lantibiotic dehydratase [Bacteroidetes bacterium]|nr:lantibiotic dehydratase [Bacteroidota bacterium]
MLLASRYYYSEYLKNKQSPPIINTLKKYWIRSCARCTPFANFSGIGVADITNDETNIVLSSKTKHSKLVRLDMEVIFNLVDYLSVQSSVRKPLKYSLNNSHYKVGVAPDILKLALKASRIYKYHFHPR